MKRLRSIAVALLLTEPVLAQTHADITPASPTPQVRQATAACPPASAKRTVTPIKIHEPRAGHRADVTVAPDQPLAFDFDPLDAQGVRHGDDLTLNFADGGVLVLHHIAKSGNPLATPLQLPDGAIINPCVLLQALSGEQANPSAGNNKIPEEKIPPDEINPASPAR
jgi:hypothetical protein